MGACDLCACFQGEAMLADVQARLARGRQVFWDAVGAGAGAGAPTHPTSPHG